jgi:hypothetical protein
MCNICGQPDYIRCNCVSQQPYCDQCDNDSKCVEKVDAQCVIYHFNSQEPSGLVNLGIPNNTDLETILEAIDDLVANGFNVPFSPTNTDTINWSPGGIANHSPSANVVVSSDPGNEISIRTNGLFAARFNPNYFVKPDAASAPGYLINKLVGDSDAEGIISLNFAMDNGVLKGTPGINLTNLFANLLNFVDTPSIDFLVSGSNPFNVSANAKISSSPGNSLTINPDGLFSSGGSSYTFDNGITETAGNVQLGGPLVKDTLISDYDFNLNLQTKTLQIGNQIVTAFTQPAGYTNDEGRKFTVRNRGRYFGGGESTSFMYSDYILEDSADVTLNSFGAYAINTGVQSHFKSNVTFTKDTQIAGFGAGIGIGTDNNANVNTGNPLSAIRTNVFLNRGSAVGEPNSTSQGDIEQVAGFYAAIPSKGVASDPNNELPDINNYYAIYLDDPDLGAIQTKITNKYGIYQVGPTSINRFFGPIQYSGSLTNVSDVRIKENILNFESGLDIIEQIDVVKYDFKEITGSSRKGVIGIIAQQLEEVFPEAISKTNMYGFEDFRMVTESHLLYLAINSIKQLSAKVKELENRL